VASVESDSSRFPDYFLNLFIISHWWLLSLDSTLA
jgi:hypothetical protein